MATRLVNPLGAGTFSKRKMSMQRDENGHREYKIKLRVISNDPQNDGPAVVAQTPGLPLPYSLWIIDNDVDTWAWCKWDLEIDQAQETLEGESDGQWDVGLTFTTKWPEWKNSTGQNDSGGSCRTEQVEDPLLEPFKISGTSVKYTEEQSKDRFGTIIASSSHERFRGPQVEFDKNRHTVKISMNVAVLNAPLVLGMLDHVNTNILWGLPPRTIKLSTWAWERKFWGTCTVYYTWTLDFDVRFDTFDRKIMDEGSLVLNGAYDTNGKWHNVNIDANPVTGSLGTTPPNPANPQHFCRYKDRFGNLRRTPLDGHGRPASTIVGSGTFGTGSSLVETDPPAFFFLQYYPEADFTLLGIPLTF